MAESEKQATMPEKIWAYTYDLQEDDMYWTNGLSVWQTSNPLPILATEYVRADLVKNPLPADLEDAAIIDGKGRCPRCGGPKMVERFVVVFDLTIPEERECDCKAVEYEPGNVSLTKLNGETVICELQHMNHMYEGKYGTVVSFPYGNNFVVKESVNWIKSKMPLPRKIRLLSDTGELIGSDLEMKLRAAWRKVAKHHDLPNDGVVEADFVRSALQCFVNEKTLQTEAEKNAK